MRGSSQDDDAGMCTADEVRNEDLRAFHLVYDLKNFSQSCPDLEIHYGLSEANWIIVAALIEARTFQERRALKLCSDWKPVC
jgi:hypothetical protein